jgi:hypothetical protein
MASTSRFNAQALLKGLWATGRNRQTEAFLKKLNIEPNAFYNPTPVKPKVQSYNFNPLNRPNELSVPQSIKVTQGIPNPLTTQATRVNKAVNPQTLENAERSTIERTTPAGSKFQWKPSDIEWESMTVPEKVQYQTNPEQWLTEKPKWEKLRASWSGVEEVAKNVFSVNPKTELYDVGNTSPEALKAQGFATGAAVTNILPIPEIKPIAQALMKGVDYLTPELAKSLENIVKQFGETRVAQAIKETLNTPLGKPLTEQRGSLGRAAEGGDIIQNFINTPTEQIVTPLRDAQLIDEIAKQTGFSRDFVETAPVETLQKALRPITEGTGQPKFKAIPKEVSDVMGNRPAEVIKATVKEPWRMKRDVYNNINKIPSDSERAFSNHKNIVRKAISEGKTVPLEVLKDYPDLVNTINAETVKPPTGQITQPAANQGAQTQKFYRVGDLSFNAKRGILNVTDNPTTALQYADTGTLAGFQKGKNLIQLEGNNLNILDIRKLSQQEQESLFGKSLLKYKESDGLLTWESLEHNPSIFRKLSSNGYDGIRVSAGKNQGQHIQIFQESKNKINLAPSANEAPQVAKTAATGGNIPPVEPPKPPTNVATPENADQFIKTFSEQLKGSKEQWDVVSQTRSEIRSARAKDFQSELKKATDSGLDAEQAYNQAIKSMSGKLPTGGSIIGDLIPESARPALESKIQQVLAGDNFEIMSTTTAFRNALVNDAIPRVKGTAGKSAYDRLVKVFGEDFVNKLEKGVKALPEHEYPPLDQALMDYLRNLPDKGNQLGMLPVAKRITLAQKLQKIGVNVVDALNIPRSIQSGYDFSMPFRQGLVAGTRHPLAWAKSWGPGLKAMRSEAIGEGIMKEILADPDVAWGISKGYLDIPTFAKNAPYMQRLESFASKFAEHIPGVRMSQRGATTFIAKLESDIWESGVKQLRKIGADESEFKAFGQFLTEAVGRGEIPKNLQKFAPVMNLLYSPRLLSSRILLPTRLFSSSAFVRKEAWSTLASMLAFGGTIIGIYKLLGGKVETDPRSADYGKLIIGRTRLDIWGGYLQYLRLASRLVTGETKTISGEVKPQKVSETIGQFIRSKESPAVGLVADIMSGQTYSGDTIKPDLQTVKTLSYENLVPLAAQDIIDATVDQGLQGGLTAFPSTVGVGITTYTTGEERNRVQQSISKLGDTDTEGLKKELEGITNPEKIKEIQAKDWTYGVKKLFSDIRDATSNVDPTQLNEKGGFDPIVEYYWDYKKLDDEYNLLSTKEKAVFVKNNPDYVAGQFMTGGWTSLKDKGSLEIANKVESLAKKYNVQLDMIPAFQKDKDGTEKIPSDKTLWKAYFEYNDLPGTSYLNMSQSQVEAGELPDKYLKDWQTYQSLKTDSAKTAFRNSHKEISKSTWRTDFRKANSAFDKWLQEQEGMKPLAKKTTTGGTTRVSRSSSGISSNVSFGSSSVPSRTSTILRKMPKPRMSTSIRAPSAPRV